MLSSPSVNENAQVVCASQGENSSDDCNAAPRYRPRSRNLGISGSIAWCPGSTVPALRPGSPMVVDTTPVAAPVPPPAAPNLPFDVLTIILQLWHALEYDREESPYSVVPYRAGGVCRSWREAVRQTPRLWTRATFNFRRMQHKASWLNYHTAHAICAGMHEYDVYLYSNLVNISKSDPVWRYFRDRILLRARNIFIEVRFEGSDEDILYGCPLPRLHTLEISASPDFHYTPSLLLGFAAPSISTLHTRFVTPSRLDPPPAGDPFSTISKFECAYSTFSLVDLEQFMLVYPSLRELHLTLQNFEGAEVVPVAWPGLRRLTIDTAMLDSSHLAGQLFFPDLQQLAVRDDQDSWAFWASLIEHRCPALTSLVVLRNHQDNSTLFVRHVAGLSRLQELIFRSGSMNNELLDLLVRDDATRSENFPSLHTISFEDTVPRSDIDIGRIWSLIYWRNRDIYERGLTPTFRLACSTRRRDPDGAESREEYTRRAELEGIVSDMTRFVLEKYSSLF